jgi:NADH-quinone oxidoreductase subunit J
MEFFSQTLPLLLFYLFCFLAIACAVGVITLRNPVSSAFSLVGVMLNVAGIYAMQSAFFVSAIQILVYAGAIMVLFVFVIMLLNIDSVSQDAPKGKLAIGGPILLSAIFLGLIGYALITGGGAPKLGPWDLATIEQAGGNVRVLSETMFSDYVLPFLIVGMLLSVAIVGAVALAKKKVD